MKKSCNNMFDIHDISKKWQKIWETNNYFKWNNISKRQDNFSIDTPPPTISGNLHMGHIFSYTQIDFIARYKRAIGKNVYFPIGFDNNGLPTERLIEKITKTKAKNLDKDKFNKLAKQKINTIQDIYKNIFKNLGMSFDWQQEYQTDNQQAKLLAQMSFINLYKKNILIEKKEPCFWDITDQTAISQAEIVDKSYDSFMYNIRFISNSSTEIIVSTTRPEMLAGCVAILFNPNDHRYLELKNKTAIVPIFNYIVKIIADEDVIINKGTGLVMCSTFGDIQDIIWWKRYKLKTKECINESGKIKNTPLFNNMTIVDAREKIIADLKTNIIKTHKIKHNVKVAERSNTKLEIIMTSQWYIKILNIKKKLKEISKKINWYPNFMEKKLENWIDGLNQDWCISRQRYLGTPLPVWLSLKKGEEGKKIIADIDNLPVDPKHDLPQGYKKNEVISDNNIMDTWVTSSLTPQINSQIINKNYHISNTSEKIFPFDLRAQSHEIIRTWTFYSIVKSLYHNKNIPWYNIMISGWCKSDNNIKMSKSKGNAIDPVKLLKKYSPDILRYWSAKTKLGTDIIFNEENFQLGKKLINKLHNLTKFYKIHLEKSYFKQETFLQIDINKIIYGFDLWILSHLSLIINKTTNAFDKYKYSESIYYIEEFLWNNLCSNYLEVTKKRIYNIKSTCGYQSVMLTLGYVIKTILILFSPFIPHVCEEFNKNTFVNTSDICKKGVWPQQKYYNQSYIEKGNTMIAFLNLIRKYKSHHNMSLKHNINHITCIGEIIPKKFVDDLQNASNCDRIDSLIKNDDTKYDFVSDCKRLKIVVSK